MSDYESFKLEGMGALIKGLAEMPSLALPVLEETMNKATKMLQAYMAKYPPSSEANRPGRVDENGRPMGYYERGRGWWYPVLRRQTVEVAGRFAALRAGESGMLFGKSRGVLQAGRKLQQSGVAGYRLRATSQMLGKSWTSDVFVVANGVEGVVGNDADYSPHVQGDTQPPLFAQRGWQTLEQGLRENVVPITNLFNQANARIASRWNGGM